MRGRKRTTHIYLSPELWRQILARLPPKTLMRFRSVSKNWRSLIDDSDFISMHFNLYSNCHANTRLLTVEEGRNSSASPPLTFTLRRSDTFGKISQLCHFSDSNDVCYGSSLVDGLLLIWKSGYLTLLNPSIRKSLTLPSCPRPLAMAFLRFLGYAPSSGDYKVVVLDRCNAIPFGMAVVFYSLRDHCWREYVMQVPKWAFEFTKWGCGFVYYHGVAFTIKDPELICFDFDSEEFRYLKLPEVEEGMCILPFVFRGSLAVFGISGIRSCIRVLENNAGNEPWRQCWNGDTNLDVYKLAKNFTPYLLSHCQIMYIEDTGTLLPENKHDSNKNRIDTLSEYTMQHTKLKWVPIVGTDKCFNGILISKYHCQSQHIMHTLPREIGIMLAILPSYRKLKADCLKLNNKTNSKAGNSI